MSRMRVENREIRDAQIFEILLDNFPDIIHSVDEHGRIVFTNKKAETLLGYTREELLGMDIRQLYADEVLDALKRGFADLKARGDKTVESVLRARDGTRIPVEIRSFSIYDDAGNFLRTFSILRDIRPIKELQNSLVHAGRLAAVGEMAAGIAHDINNPLTVVTLAAQMMAREVQRIEAVSKSYDPTRCHRILDDIRKAAKSIEKLVTHLRNFSRGVAEKREDVDLHVTLADAVFMAANRIKACGVEVDNRVERGVHFTHGCPNQLEQIFVNLVTNACDAMAEREERRLTLTVSPDSDQGVDYWRCDVTDTGTGIPPRIREAIFQAFFTTKEKGKGTGLGLSISRGIAREHGGDVRVASEAGRGTTFSVLLRRTECGRTAG